MTFCGFIFVLLLAASTHLAGVLGKQEDVKCNGVIDSEDYTGHRRCEFGWKYMQEIHTCIQVFDKKRYAKAAETCRKKDGEILGDLKALEHCFDGNITSEINAIWENPPDEVKGIPANTEKCPVLNVNGEPKEIPCRWKRYFLCGKTPLVPTPSPSTRAPPPPPPTTTTSPITTTMTTTSPPPPTTTIPITTTVTTTSSPPPPPTTTTPITTTVTTTSPPPPTTTTTPITTTTTTTSPPPTTTPMTSTTTKPILATTTEQDFSCPVSNSSKCSTGWLHVHGGLCLMLMNKPSDLKTLEQANQSCVERHARLFHEGEITPLFQTMIGCQGKHQDSVSVSLNQINIKKGVWLQEGCKTFEFKGSRIVLDGTCFPQDSDLLVCAANVEDTIVPDVPEFDLLRFLFGSQTMPVDTIDSGFKIETPPVRPTTSTTRSMTASTTTLKTTTTEVSCPVYEQTMCPDSKWVSVGAGRCLLAYPTTIKKWDDARQECERFNSSLLTSKELAQIPPKCLNEVLSHSGIRSNPFLGKSSVWLDDCKRVQLSQHDIIDDKTDTSCPLQDFVYPLCAVNVSISEPEDAVAQQTTSQPHTTKSVTDKDSTTTVSTSETWPRGPDTEWSYEGSSEQQEGYDNYMYYEEDSTATVITGETWPTGPDTPRSYEGPRDRGAGNPSETQGESYEVAQDIPRTGKDKEFAETATVLGIPVVVIPVVLITIIAADIIAIAVYKNRDRLMRHFGLLPISDKRDLKNAEEGNVDADVNDTGSGEAKNEDDQGEGRASNGIEEKKATNEAGAEKPGEEGGAAKSGDEDDQKASSDEKGEEKARDGTEEKTDEDKKEEKTGEDKEEEKPGGEKGGESSDEKKEEKTGEDKGEEKPDGGKEDKSGDGKGEGKSGEEKEGEKSLDKEACEKSEGSNTEEKSGERDAKAPDGEKEEEKTSAEKEKKETSSESDGEKSDEGKGDDSEDSEEEDND